MMPNITRGDRMGGLMVYLAGPGRANQHTEPHLVAGDPALMAWHDDNELGRNDALAIARHLDRPRKALGVEVPGGHVWHCSLSLRAEEGQLGDEKWQEIAERFMAKMGLDDAEGTKAPTRWVAVRHGVSEAGNDHVHVAVNLVREDGTKASIHNDRPRAQTACRELEIEFGLERLESAGQQRSSRGFDPAERQAAARRAARGAFENERRKGTEARSWPNLDQAERDSRVATAMVEDQPRWALARAVRGCATAARSEAEFVRRMRGQDVLVRARFAEGTDDVVTGYSVAAKPATGQRPIWYGGGRLARDLTLPRLRAEWPDTPDGASTAAAEWRAAKRGRKTAGRGPEHQPPGEHDWLTVEKDAQRLREQLRTVPVDDRQAWARVARETSGAFAAWSRKVEATPGPLAAASDALARSAELKQAPPAKDRTQGASLVGAALLLSAAGESKNGMVAQAAMFTALVNVAKAVHDAHRAQGDARQAARIAAVVRQELVTVAAQLPSAHEVQFERGAATAAQSGNESDVKAFEAVRRAQQGQRAPGQGYGSPVPNRLPTEDERAAAAARQRSRTSGRGSEREGR